MIACALANAAGFNGCQDHAMRYHLPIGYLCSPAARGPEGAWERRSGSDYNGESERGMPSGFPV